MATRTCLSIALEYAQRGWYVFPCRAKDKAPLTTNGWKDATRNHSKIVEWWTRWPDANVAIATGPSGLVVIDVDTKHEDGLEQWHNLKEELGIDDETPTVETPSGGLHIYYDAGGRKIRNSAGRLAPGIDVRADGGYVVAPPSATEAGDYAWALGLGYGDVELKTLPEALAARLIARPASGTAISEDERIIPAGRRNATLASIAGTLRRQGLDQEAIEAALLVHNAKYCKPPLAEDEVRKIARSIARYSIPIDDELATGDRGHAIVLANAWRDKYIFATHKSAWLRWSGKVWEEVSDEIVARCASDVLVDTYAEMLSTAETEEERAALRKKIREASSHARVSSVLKFLAGTEGFSAGVEVFDSNPWLLNLENGILDLRTGKLLEHNAKAYCTKIAKARFDANARAPKWLEHLSYFLPDPDVRRQVQRDLGLSLVGTPLEERLSIWYGLGANGKSTTARVIMALLNDYAGMAAPGLLVTRKNEAHPTEVADLVGRRCVFASEIAGAVRLDEAKVKQITGGDRVKARFLWQDFFEFEQTWSIALLCNHRPIITGSDEGIWRRVRLIPWRVSITSEARRPQVEVIGELLAESSGILNWLLGGLQDWLTDKDWLAEQVRVATEAYRNEQDRIGGFIAACCKAGDGLSVSAKDLYDAYVQWCAENGEQPLSQTGFGRQMDDRGFIKERKGKSRRTMYYGLTLQEGLGTKDVEYGVRFSQDETEITFDDLDDLLD